MSEGKKNVVEDVVNETAEVNDAKVGKRNSDGVG